MSERKKAAPVLLLGDAAIDYFLSSSQGGVQSGHLATRNWQNHAQWQLWKKPGGVALMAEMLSDLQVPLQTAATKTNEHGYIRSLARLAPRDPDGTSAKGGKYRVHPFEGYGEPDDSAPPFSLPAEIPPGGHRLVVLDDPGNGFRDMSAAWEQHLAQRSVDLIVHKMSLPLAKGSLWERIVTLEAATRVVVVSAEDLRRQGVDLSRRLSWDRTVEDLLNEATDRSAEGPLFSLVRGCTFLVVCFDCDAAAVLRGGGDPNSTTVTLFYDPLVVEGDTDDQIFGSIPGRTSCFVSHLVHNLWARGETDSLGPDELCTAVRHSLIGMRQFSIRNLEVKGGVLVYPKLQAVRSKPRKEVFYRFATCNGGKPLSIASTDTAEQAREVAEKVLLSGFEKLGGIPTARFGKFRTIDRREIEGYRAVADLLGRHFQSTSVSKPLSIAVFGPPGAGKSFGVKEIVGDQVPFKEYNVAEFGNGDLAGSLQELRDIVLTGKKPLCFFDEFDADNLAHLAKFLAPMQDGKFRDGSRRHPIGAAVFVFAGGTAKSFAEFSKKAAKPENAKFKAKDFLSRLSGFIDVRGPNPVEPEKEDATTDDETPLSNNEKRMTEDEESGAYILRRAVLMRSIFEKNYKNLISDKDELAIDRPVVNAFLGVRRFNHGTRSIETLLRMSELTSESKRLTVADLPFRDQLALHVDPTEFEKLLKAPPKQQ